MTEIVWVRAGDHDDYNEFESVAELARYLGRADPKPGALQRCTKYGVADPDHYTGHNYISVFWGNEAAEAIRDLSDTELTELNSLLGSP